MHTAQLVGHFRQVPFETTAKRLLQVLQILIPLVFNEQVTQLAIVEQSNTMQVYPSALGTSLFKQVKQFRSLLVNVQVLQFAI